MDDIDKKIIMLLKENSRTPVSLIAQKVGRSRTVVAKRIDELVNSGEISKFTVQLKQKKLPVLFFVKVAEGFRCKDVIRHFKKEYFFNSAISINCC